MRILLIISGSIAAYKSLETIRLLKKEGAEVNAILTRGGAEFITPLAVSSLTGNQTYTDLFSLKDEVEMGHIRLSREADLILVAPASADLIAKMAQGNCDDLASATLLAANKPIFVAPAMNHKMWDHPATKRNIKQIASDGVTIIEPVRGEMACGEEGIGRMAEPESIVSAVLKSGAGKTLLLTKTSAGDAPLRGKKVVVTSGPTYEAIDPVRFIGNFSSGKQGHAIAASLAVAGAHVTLVTGPSSLPDPANVKVIHVRSAESMHNAVMKQLPVDIAVCAAAVSDWTPVKPAAQKLKKRKSNLPPELKLRETEDILSDLSHHKKRPTLVIGFAAETENLLANARAKYQKKGCDWLFANDVSDGKIFGTDGTKLTHLTAKGATEWPAMTKSKAAEKITAEIARFFANTSTANKRKTR